MFRKNKNFQNQKLSSQNKSILNFKKCVVQLIIQNKVRINSYTIEKMQVMNG